jgi:hypothetical protein
MLLFVQKTSFFNMSKMPPRRAFAVSNGTDLKIATNAFKLCSVWLTTNRVRTWFYHGAGLCVMP